MSTTLTLEFVAFRAFQEVVFKELQDINNVIGTEYDHVCTLDVTMETSKGRYVCGLCSCLSTPTMT